MMAFRFLKESNQEEAPIQIKVIHNLRLPKKVESHYLWSDCHWSTFREDEVLVNTN